MKLFWVDINYACFGIISENDVVVNVAPIAAWMKNKKLSEIKSWLLKKKAKVIEVK